MTRQADAILERLHRRLYGKPLIRNVLRGELVEQMVLDALGGDWQVGGDYESWDLRQETSGARMQIKQSAALQSWSDAKAMPSRPQFSIRESHGYSGERQRWSEPRQRHCELYIFAWPGVIEAADHRDPHQWTFYVARASDLPLQQTIGLRGISALVAPCKWSELNERVDEALA